MTNERTIRFPDGEEAEATIDADTLGSMEERLCVNCGGPQPRSSFEANQYTALKCPTCGLVHVGEPIQ